MKIVTAFAVCLVVLYAVDAHYMNGEYFQALKLTINNLIHTL